MAEAQIPDLSGFSEPEDMPVPRTAHMLETNQAPEPTMQGGSPLQRQRHANSLSDTDSIVKNPPAPPGRQRAQDSAPIPIDRPQQGSIVSRDRMEMLNELNKTGVMPESAQVPQAPANNVPMQEQVREPQPQVANLAPTVKRDIRELYQVGRASSIEMAGGFELRLHTLTAEDWIRANALASMYPEGTARDSALRQNILAHAITHINGYPLENMCDKKDLTDSMSRKGYVLSNIDYNLMKEFFAAYTRITLKAQELIDVIGQVGAAEAASFFPKTQR